MNVLKIIAGMVLSGLLASCSGDNSEPSEASASSNKGWKWAEKARVKSAVQCEELEDPNERSGCEAYVIFVSAQNATSP